MRENGGKERKDKGKKRLRKEVGLIKDEEGQEGDRCEPGTEMTEVKFRENGRKERRGKDKKWLRNEVG